MNASGRQQWFRIVIVLSVVYFAIGIAFGAFAGWSTSGQMRVAWRLLAFLTSAVAFAIHIAYERFRLRNRPLTTASHASMAVAIGAFALAVAANFHSWGVASSNRRLLALALVTFPAVTAVPAFVVALILAAGLTLRRRRDV